MREEEDFLSNKLAVFTLTTPGARGSSGSNISPLTAYYIFQHSYLKKFEAQSAVLPFAASSPS